MKGRNGLGSFLKGDESNMNAHNLITQQAFLESSREFKQREGRAAFYDLAVNLMDRNLPVEGCILLLSTWNFASFRYAVKSFDVGRFRKVLQESGVILSRMRDQSIRAIELSDYSDDICTVYETLAAIKGMEHTGTSKVMHLLNRELFVMWDGYIRGEHPKRFYENLPVITAGFWSNVKYDKSGRGYIDFMSDMQRMFSHLQVESDRKTLSKAIDEYNYVNITLRIQERKALEKVQKKKNKKERH